MGSTIYEVETARQPYYDKTDTEIERLFSVQVSPDTRALVLGEVVAKCWRMEYKDIGKSMADISHIQLEGKCANTVRNKGERAWWGKR